MAKAQNSASVDIATILTGQVESGKQNKSKATWLTALYLRPVEQAIDSRENWPLIPAQLLEAVPTHSVETPDGPKPVSKLKKGDVLYRYEFVTQRVSAWEVRIVQRKARRADAVYSMAHEEGLSIVNYFSDHPSQPSRAWLPSQ